MKTPISSSLQFFLDLAKLQAIMSRRFDRGLGGLGLNEFIILLHLSQAPETKMRRIDLAERVGLTASGVTRILLPMEKIGLISKEVNEYDARVSLVMLAPGGARKLEEGLERAELLCSELAFGDRSREIAMLAEILGIAGRSVL
ncbi:MAG: Transcriptional regulator, MarR family [Candidatus Wolfebacteria bacterium GW2011_GWE1_48_7]|uniref:Transcriptional regulator, MarR family n=2 Tax=Candidatus Wolfeibacteriota TaxID=1752735 RepID=A0A0G1X4V7_9BACT|nr:MAG: MarR family transcriptional regulator [Candidatus Wolfebacteria bacterium GW2011_GWB1_47_1]KKU34827.1 MAG: Transcriptional regulator, MarR family [Candidatus Wolfebacteria bacterium GW2011_GWC2_46_275]KKU42490.1 MAG: Transcriptional regulator, MarR family [Candidatus Wolfebacteria bacterium GW2011_GWB2_46_69]KKU54275.1 MAG: Transcriptional regulator, MarR family [Candidatus Wolfebacteria bacterium GW2011_GWC1_47_103]KKU59643.1 MAG: Transcriptional regulator, MarR family [Candidatus Wolf